MPAAVILTDYLRQRWGLTAAEPTPQEIVAHLEHQGCAEPCLRQAAAFYAAWDTDRFAPHGEPPAGNGTTAAVRLIRTLEEQP
jgi:hypothetical protein